MPEVETMQTPEPPAGDPIWLNPPADVLPGIEPVAFVLAADPRWW